MGMRHSNQSQENTMKTTSVALMLSLLICSFAVMASKPVDLIRIVEQQQALAAQFETPAAMKATGLDMQQIETIRAAQNDVFATIGDRKVLSELTPAEQVDLKNALETIDVALQGTLLAERHREKCWRDQKLGTKMKITRCATQLELAQVREGARDWWEKGDICTATADGSCGPPERTLPHRVR
jgi:hypothetical protein